MTDQDIADEIGINVKTLYDWKNKHSKIRNALKKTKEIYDSEVEEALERSALGYYVFEEKWTNKWNAKTKEFELILTEKQKKWIKPDTTAQIFWLKNRDKLHWRDRQEVDVEGSVEGVAILPKREILKEIPDE